MTSKYQFEISSKRYLTSKLYYPVFIGLGASFINLFRIDTLDSSLIQALCATYGKVFPPIFAWDFENSGKFKHLNFKRSSRRYVVYGSFRSSSMKRENLSISTSRNSSYVNIP